MDGSAHEQNAAFAMLVDQMINQIVSGRLVFHCHTGNGKRRWRSSMDQNDRKIIYTQGSQVLICQTIGKDQQTVGVMLTDRGWYITQALAMMGCHQQIVASLANDRLDAAKQGRKKVIMNVGQ